MPLNINLQQILLHMLNFVILFGALYFLLYQPVKNFMDARRAGYEKMEAAAKADLAAAEQTKEEYEARLKNADGEIAARKQEADAAMQRAAGERRALAEKQAEEIIRKARENALHEREQLLAQARGEISELMGAAAEKLVLGSENDAYEQFLAAAEERGDDA